MALGKQASMANVKASLDQYIFDSLGPEGEELNIDYEGLEFETTEKKEWIQPRIMDFNRDYLRQGSATEYGSLNNVTLNINIFVNQSGATLADKHYRIRDTIVNYFKVGQSISIKDHLSGATSPTTLNYLKVRRLITDRPIPSEDLLQYTLTWEMDYTELTTEA